MSVLSTSIYGSSTNKGYGGLLSGLDTDELVNQMTAGTRNKINRQYQAKQKLLYRQEAYREVSSKLIAFSNKYFSYSSGSKTNILSSNFFESYTFKSSSNYVNVTGNADNIQNFEINSISQVATAANFTSAKKVSSQKFQSEIITANTSTLAGATFTIEFKGENYNLAIDKDFGKDFPDVSDAKLDEVLNKVVEQLNKQLATIKDNENNNLLKYTVDDGKIVFENEGKAKLVAANSAITDNLNMEVGKEAISKEGVKVGNLIKDAKSILQSKDSYITFEFNGVLKTINLKEKATVPKVDGTMEEINIEDADSLKRYLQSELDKAYGKDKVVIGVIDNKLTFSAKDGNSNIFGVSSISTELSNFTGIESGDYNRVNKRVAIEEAGLSTVPTSSKLVDEKGEEFEGYEILVNDIPVKIKKGASLNDIIKQINNETDVNIYYSATTDTFTVKAKETGEHKGVKIEGDLAEALFGTTSANSKLGEGEYIRDNAIYKLESDGKTEKKVADIKYDESNKYTIDYVDDTATDITGIDFIINAGTDTKMTYTLNGVQNTITRSTANFTIDEINIELNEKAKNIDFSNPVTFDVTNNADEVVERVKKFIEEYNEIIGLVGTGTSERPKRDYPPLSPEQQDEMKEEEIKNWTAEAKKGALYGDIKMNNLLRNMRESMSGFTGVSSLTLSSIGISAASMDTSGKLVLDEKKFKEKLLENPDEIASLFTEESGNENVRSGIAVQLQDILKKNVGAYGTTGLLIEEAGMANSMTADKNFISERIEEYDDKMTELKKSLATERQRYWNKFAALEQSLNKLNAQSSWLTDMMGN